jgi:2,5-diketo-D-gluconate reductase A
MTDSTVPTVTLNDDRRIPQLGFGVFQVPPEQTQETVELAFEAGYRHIDTAQMYGNEAGVGAAITASGLPREELWITTKLNNGFHRPDDARREFAASLDRLGLDQVDLFLIHWPLPTRYDGDYASTWRTLTELQEDGRARSVGVSNFEPAHLKTVIDATGVVPAVNQIEVHPFFGNEAARAADAQHGITTEAWAPIAKGRVNDDPTIKEIAERVGRSPAQVALRWHVQRGDIVFPKSMRAERMRENFAIFDFELSDDDVATITGLDRGEDGRTGPNPNSMDWLGSS